MQFADPSIWAKIERFTKSIAWKSHFPMAEFEDLVQSVYAKVLDPRYKNKVIPNGVIHYGYLEKCIWTEIKNYYKKNDSGNWFRSDEPEGDMDCYSSELNFIDDLEVTQMLEWLIAWCNAMPEGLRKDVCRYCLSGMTDGGSKQGRDIAVKLDRDQKPVSQALSYIRDNLKLELAFL